MSDPTDRRLVGDLRAKARHGDLVTLFGQPHTEPEADLLIMLARFLADNEIGALAGLVHRAVGDAAQRCRDLLAEVAHHVQTTAASAGKGKVYAVLPTVLTALIQEAAGDQTPDE
jgi:hypothetical protein